MDTEPSTPTESSPAATDAADALNENPFDYSHEPVETNEPADAPQTEGEASSDPTQPEAAPADYALDLGEYWGGTDQLRGNINTRAQEAGITAEQGSRFVSSVIADMHAEEQARLAAGAQQLRADWGEQYNSNVKATQEFISRAAQGAGLSPQQVALLNSREGFLLMNSIRQGLGESRATSSSSTTPPNSRDQARDMLHNPNNPYHEALTNLNAPLEKRREAVQRYNELMGMTIFPMP